jgi:hypothetical protein
MTKNKKRNEDIVELIRIVSKLAGTNLDERRRNEKDENIKNLYTGLEIISAVINEYPDKTYDSLEGLYNWVNKI